MPPLLSLARFENGDLESQRYACFALTNLSCTKANHAVMVDTETIPLISTLMDHQDIEIRNTCAFSVANFASNPINHQLILKEGCLPKLVALLSVDDKNAQLRAVSALRGLSTDVDIRLDIVDSNAIDPLLILAKSNDVEVQMETLATLCNLSLCGCIGDNPLSFLDAVNVKNLVAFLCSADSTYRLFGAVTIGNIVSSVPLQDQVIEGGALAPLVTVANAADLETQRCIAYALCNLAADPRRRTDIVNEGGLPSLISMACSDDRSDQLAAMATLRGISAQAENRRGVFKANISEALVLGTRSIDMEVKVETAAVLAALSINDDNKLEMSNDDQLLISVIELLKVSDVRCLRQAMGCLANLSERQECHPFLRRFQIHVIVLDHIANEDVALGREVTRVLTNLAAVHDNHPPLIGGGAIGGLALCCAKKDAVSARFSALGLDEFVHLQENHRDIVAAKTYEPLIDLAEGSERFWYTLDSNGAISEMRGDTEPDSPRAKADWEFIQEYKYDKEARRYAVLALGNLAISPLSHGPLMQERCIAALNQSLDSPDPETRFNAAFCLNKLAIAEENIQFIGESGSIPCLINMLTMLDEPDGVAQATATLRHLAMRVENRVLILEANCLDPLASVAKVKDYETLREVATLCCLMSLTDSIRMPLVASNVILPLTALCGHEDVEIGRQACGALANCAEAKRTHKRLATHAHAMHHMVFIMRSKHLAIHREAARCVSNLVSSSAFHRLFLDDGGLVSLFRLCRSLDKETLYNCSLIFRKLSPVLTNHEFIIGKGGIAPY